MGSKMMSVVGARPNFMKVAAICEAIKEHNRHGEDSFIDHVLVHTGQHYDANMCFDRRKSLRNVFASILEIIR